MPKSPSRGKPLVFVADDDPVFLKLAVQWLSKFGAQVEAFPTLEKIQERLRIQKPQFCIIDVNLVREKAGFELIQWVRGELSKTLPLIAVSTDTDTASVAHAIEIGANDYLLKPLNREVLVTKLQDYLKSDEIQHEAQGLPAVPETEMKVDLVLGMQVQEIDELGIRVLSKHLITKGTVLSISGAFVEALSGRAKPVQVSAASTWVESAQDAYGAYLEFDTLDHEIAGQVRNWIAGKTRV